VRGVIDVYYSIMDFHGNDESFYLGRTPLTETTRGVIQEEEADPEATPVADGGVLDTAFPYDHSNPENAVPIPDSVDTACAAELAPMLCYYGTPFNFNDDIFDDQPRSVHVLEIDSDDSETTGVREVEAIERNESTTWSNGELVDRKRWIEYDNEALSPEVVDDGSPAFRDANYVIGYTNFQTMLHKYVHLGLSAADTGAGALRDILERLDGWPLFDPVAYPVSSVNSYPASSVLTYPSEFAQSASQ
jgi:hypothetical protein